VPAHAEGIRGAQNPMWNTGGHYARKIFSRLL
jgi:hypothetical protein